MNPDTSSPAGDSLTKKLTKYSSATLGGIAGLTAGFEASEAALVVTNVSATADAGDFAGAKIDLNNDGTDDLMVAAPFGSLPQLIGQGLNGARQAGVLGGAANLFYPTAFQTGGLVGSGLTFSGGVGAPTNEFGTLAMSAPLTSAGNWLGGETAYVGVQFDIGGNTHYGWVHVEWDPGADPATGTHVGNILRYAYEDVADAPALVPEPSSLALLGLGAMGLAARRRRKN